MAKLVLLTLLLYVFISYVNGARCALGVQSLDEINPSFINTVVYTIDIDTGIKYHYNTETFQGGVTFFGGTALDRDTNTLYAMSYIDGVLYSYDIFTEQETRIGTTQPALPLVVALDFYNGLLYAGTDTGSFYFIDLNTFDAATIGSITGTGIQSLKVAKDGNSIYFITTTAQLIRAGTTENEFIFGSDILGDPRFGTNPPKAMDWLNDDPNNDIMVICFDGTAGCWTFNVSDSSQTPIQLFAVNDNSGVTGFELLYNDYETCDILTSLSPSISPTLSTRTPTVTPTGNPAINPAVNPSINTGMPNGNDNGNGGGNVINIYNIINGDVTNNNIVSIVNGYTNRNDICLCFGDNILTSIDNACKITYMGGAVH